MDESQPTLDQWRRLYEATIRVKEIAPWEWMTETDVFGVQSPETGETGFVSVMGALGEHLAVAVYLGAEGLYSFWSFQQIADFASPEAILGLLHLQASFEDRNTLRKKDRDVIKEVGLKFRGRQAWPMFRSYRPGFYPWYLETGEAQLLAYALEQLVEVAPRFKEDPALLDMDDDERYLVRVPRKKAGSLLWADHFEIVSPPELKSIQISMDLDVLEEVEQLPRVQNTLEMDFFAVPVQIADERGARPYFPHVLLVVESDSGFIFTSELQSPESGLEVMWGQIPVNVVHQLAKIGVVPYQIRVRSSLLAELLQTLVEELGFEVKQTHNLPSLDQAKESLLEWFS